MVTIAEVSREAGYQTSLTGKRHWETRLEASLLRTDPESGEAVIAGLLRFPQSLRRRGIAGGGGIQTLGTATTP